MERAVFVTIGVGPVGTASTPRMVPGVCPTWSGLGCARRVGFAKSKSWMLTLGVASASLGLVGGFVTMVTRGVVLAIALILLRVILGVGSHGWRQLVDKKVRTNLLTRIMGYSGTLSCKDAAVTDSVLVAATHDSGRPLP
nr:hypothetical protein [Tanacetum cinerariifolium]